MKLQYLGTAAAEGAPALFCTCDFCRYARMKGGHEVRTRSGSMIDGRLKLDFGPDSYKQMLDHGLDYTYMKSVLVTHSHDDHFSHDIFYRRPGFAQLNDDVPLMTIYGNEAVGRVVAPFESRYIGFKRMVPFETVQIEDYAVTALEAVHCISSGAGAGWPVVFENRAYMRAEEALFYLIEKDGKSLLYAHDTDEFTPADMEFLAGRRIDLISMDCTNGVLQANYVGHMGCADNLRMRDKLLKSGAADMHTVFVANHFSHNGLVPIEELERRLPGFIIAWDGLTVEI